MDIFELEAQKAIEYRDSWDKQILFRAGLLQSLAGSPAEAHRLWENFEPIYNKTNYIPGQPDEDYMTVFDFDDDESVSSSSAHISGAEDNFARETADDSDGW